MSEHDRDRRRPNVPGPDGRTGSPGERRTGVTSGRPPRRTEEKSLVERQTTAVAGTRKEKRLIKKEQKNAKYLQKVEEDRATELERNAGVVRTRSGVDVVMLTVILLLLSLGTVMVFSASYPSALAKENDSLYYIKRQAVFVLIGLVVMIIASLINYKFYRKIAIPVFLVALGLLVLVFPFGASEGEAKRWLGIPNTPFSLQPSEVAKIALVLILAWYFDKYREYAVDRINTKPMIFRGVVAPILLVGSTCVLVLLEKHLSGTIIIGLIGFIIMIIAGCSMKWTFLIGGIGAGAAIPAYLFMNPYALKRITTFFDKNADILDEKWQTNQGLYAIGSGGLFGVGLGSSRQKYSYVSAAQNDFIFTIWCEEMGFIGAVVLIALFLFFMWRGFKIAMNAPDTFSSLTAYGITAKVGIQAFINIAVCCDVGPNTGVSLPFFSYGGSSLVILMAEMGILLSISKHSYQRR